MPALTPLGKIHVPPPKPEELYETRLVDRTFTFSGLKSLLGAADFDKSGDHLAGLAAANDVRREAARLALSRLTLRHLYEHPLVEPSGRIDQVMRVNYDIDAEVFSESADLTTSQAKDFILRARPAAVKRFGTGLTGTMVAAITKLMDVHELIFAARKLKRSATARTCVGLPGTLSSRLQPNHPTDDLAAVTLLIYTGLSLGSGDALIGLNPANDTVDNTCAILAHLDALRRQHQVPTQICVLSHIKTQLSCLERGAPVEIMFQSLAGTDRTLNEEFDCTVELLDHAYRTMATRGPLGPNAAQFMYFETGQGSELAYSKHNGIDMTTAEALCYGLARRYDPFMVNNVTGFIGPETHRTNHEMILSNLQDHFMGKLMGLPMGMAPCYTLHSEIAMEGQQIATELLTAAGANYFMDVYLSIDRMLAYFDTCSHDDQTMREIYGLEPAPAFTAWALDRGIFQRDADGILERGPNWGNPRIFCSPESDYHDLRTNLPAAYGWENAGPRPANAVSREIKANLAVAREAILAGLSIEKLGPGPFRTIRTLASSKTEHLNNPETGSQLNTKQSIPLTPEDAEVQILISDGLSAEAVHHNIPDLLPVLMDGLTHLQISVGVPLLAPYGRVKLAEKIGATLRPKVVINLIGERPGGDALASRSLSAYLVYRLEDETARRAAQAFSEHSDIQYEYTVISNIYSHGIPPLEAGSLIAERVAQILKHRAAGNRLESILSSRHGKIHR
ncbi:MAG: ethanolamine ammonia-lyase subunit EutB [Limisphaerales bacterium]|jgi:ethanolamine ammonia-lyase large subunit